MLLPYFIRCRLMAIVPKPNAVDRSTTLNDVCQIMRITFNSTWKHQVVCIVAHSFLVKRGFKDEKRCCMEKLREEVNAFVLITLHSTFYINITLFVLIKYYIIGRRHNFTTILYKVSISHSKDVTWLVTILEKECNEKNNLTFNSWRLHRSFLVSLAH